MMTANNYPLNLPGSYIRVQTGYYKKCMQPTVSKEFMEMWIPWKPSHSQVTRLIRSGLYGTFLENSLSSAWTI
jgi:hypothetical protein